MTAPEDRITTTFDDVEVEGDLRVQGTVTIAGEDLNRRFADVLEAIAASQRAVTTRLDGLEAKVDRIEGKLDQALNR